MPEASILAKLAVVDLVGKNSEVWHYERGQRTPMNIVLDAAEEQIGPKFSVYWVQGGPPEVFTLTGNVPAPVVFSTHYLSLSVFMRQLFTNELLKDHLADISEKASFRLMAEMALRYGDPDFAAVAFAKSLSSFVIPMFGFSDDDRVTMLEYEVVNEAYMATWFYGLAHELGHLIPEQTQDQSLGPLFTDEVLLEGIELALETLFQTYPEAFRTELLETAVRKRSNSVIGLDNLRSETLADIFAASLLFHSTSKIMHDLGGEQFNIVNFIQEIIIFRNIIAIIDRCRRLASTTRGIQADRAKVFEMGVHPISIYVRAFLQRQYYMKVALASYEFDTNSPDRKQLEIAQSLIEEVEYQYLETINLIDSGMASTIDFALKQDQWRNYALLSEAHEANLFQSPVHRLETQKFCELAESLEIESVNLQALKRLTE